MQQLITTKEEFKKYCEQAEEANWACIQKFDNLMAGGFVECGICGKKVPDRSIGLVYCPKTKDMEWGCNSCRGIQNHNVTDKSWFRFLDTHPEKRKEYGLEKSV